MRNHSEQKAIEISAQFEKIFGRPPQFMTRAPGRVNLIGEHVDYNGGKVLPIAIQPSLYLAAAVAPNGRRTSIRSNNLKQTGEIRSWCDAKPCDEHWLRYIHGVGYLFPHDLPNFDIFIDSDIPVGAGLSSSAALEVACLKLFESMTGKKLTTIDAALLCQRAEWEFAGVPCGVMDQMAILAGRRNHATLIDCSTMSYDFVGELDDHLSFLIVNSLESHSLACGAYAKRRSECEAAAVELGHELLGHCTQEEFDRQWSRLSRVARSRARHVVSEIGRVDRFVDAMKDGDWISAGEVLYASHASLANDFEVSSPGLDALVAIAQSIGVINGVYGCRMTGGGFGGSVVALVDGHRIDPVTEGFINGFKKRMGYVPQVIATRPDEGAETIGLSKL